MTADTHALVELDRTACLALLGSVPLGRLVTTGSGLASVVPVNFVLQPDGIYLRTGGDSAVLRRADQEELVAFEADAYDARSRTGWSVVVHGRAHRVTDPRAVAHLAASPLDPWAGAQRHEVVRIELELVNGRRAGGTANPEHRDQRPW